MGNVTDALNQAIAEDDVEELLDIKAMDTELFDGYWERYLETVTSLKESGDWPKVKSDGEEIRVERNNTITCTASLHDVERPGHPRQVTPHMEEVIDFDDQCAPIDQKAIEIWRSY